MIRRFDGLRKQQQIVDAAISFVMARLDPAIHRASVRERK